MVTEGRIVKYKIEAVARLLCSIFPSFYIHQLPHSTVRFYSRNYKQHLGKHKYHELVTQKNSLRANKAGP